MGWIAGAWATGAWAGTAWATQDAPVEVPDVVGETQSAGTATLEGEGFVVAVQTEHSSTVPAGTIISQSPTGGSSAASGSTVTITVSLGERATGGGLPRKRRYFVQIDGRDFEVRSAQEATSLLEQAAELAQKAAERQAEQLVLEAPKELKVRPVAPRVPVIRTDAPIDLTPYRKAIERAYRNAAAAAEIRLLLDAQVREDEEMAAYLLLH